MDGSRRVPGFLYQARAREGLCAALAPPALPLFAAELPCDVPPVDASAVTGATGTVAGAAPPVDGPDVAVGAGVTVGVVPGAVVGVVVGVAAGVVVGVAAGVVTGVAAGVAAGVVAGVDAGLVPGVDAGVAAGLVAGVAAGVVAGVEAGVPAGAAAGPEAAGGAGIAGVADMGVAAGVADARDGGAGSAALVPAQTPLLPLASDQVPTNTPSGCTTPVKVRPVAGVVNAIVPSSLTVPLNGTAVPPVSPPVSDPLTTPDVFTINATLAAGVLGALGAAGSRPVESVADHSPVKSDSAVVAIGAVTVLVVPLPKRSDMADAPLLSDLGSVFAS